MARKLREEFPIDELPDTGSGRDPILRPRSNQRSIGPSDSSDSGSDLDGLPDLDDTSDREATGSRASADLEDEAELRPDADIEPDRVVGARQAGLGGGLDQAEEAQFGVTDEQLAALQGDNDDD
jgi:hypothetical protein